MRPHKTEPHRRHFLQGICAAGAFFSLHDLITANELELREFSTEDDDDKPRILQLELLSSAPMAEMKQFYHVTLGLPIVEEKPNRLTIDAGLTRISFLESAEADGKPFYHFAFNIPENKILAAHQWQRERCPLLPIPERLRDAKFPDDVVNYSHWNAHSVFFFDPAGNVVEYIARHDLKNAARGDFSSEDILYASEIAFVVDDVTATATKLKEITGAEQYRGASDQIAAIGDEHGLLLVMKRGRMISFDSPQRKEVSVFATTAAVRGQRPAKYEHPEFPYELSVEN